MSLLLLLKSAAAAGAPVNTSTPTIAGTQRVGATLTATTGAWTNAPTSFTFQWQSATTLGGAYSNIVGATSQAYVLTSTELGKFLKVIVTATNGSGSTPATSAGVGAILAALATYTANVAALRPTMLVAINFAGLVPVWSDVTPYIRDALSTSRGRANALDRIEAGQGSFGADNYDRRFEPEYAASPYYPNVVPMRGIRFQAVYNGTLYQLHQGFVQGWPITWPAVKRSRAAISSSDGFDLLNAPQITQLFPFAQTGAMINAILDAINFPATQRLIDAGEETVLGIDAQKASPLDLIQQVADSEGGLFFFDGAGNAVFHSRDHRLLAARSTVVQATFGDGTVASGELPYLTPETDFDVSRIYNDVAVASGLATPTTIPATDATSQGAYGVRSLSRSTLLSDDAAASDQSQRILSGNKDPHLRFPSIVVDPTRDARLWPVVLGLEISDRVKVIRRPYAGGAAITREMWVEAIKHDITLGQSFAWRTTLSLSLADPFSYWTLDSSTKSLLDSTTVLR